MTARGTVRWTSVAGARATIRFTGSAVALVGPVSRVRGGFRAYLDGQLIGIGSERASIAAPRRVVFARAIPPGTHTLRIVTIGNGRIDIDAIVTLG